MLGRPAWIYTGRGDRLSRGADPHWRWSGIPSGVLEDVNGNPLPDGFTFPATIFVEGTVIYDILAFNAYQFSPVAGILWWGSDGGPPIPVQFSGGITTAVLTVQGTVVMSGLPTSDPTSAGRAVEQPGHPHRERRVSAG